MCREAASVHDMRRHAPCNCIHGLLHDAMHVEAAGVGMRSIALMVGLHGTCTAWITIAYSCDRIDLTIVW